MAARRKYRTVSGERKFKKFVMIIHNYGLYWDIDKVWWGKQNNEGELLGFLKNNKSLGLVNFNDQYGIYALYSDYDLIYIGQTGRVGLFSRLKSHKNYSRAGRWNQFSWFGTRQVINKNKLKAEKITTSTTHKDALHQMEAILISVSEPKLNKKSGNWGKDVKEYIQVRDERLGPSLNEMMKKIYEISVQK